MGSALKHQTPPDTAPVTSDGLRRNQLALEALIVAAGAAGVLAFNTRSGVVTLTSGDVTTALTFTPVSAATVAAGYQPLDSDLTALAALAGTNTIYYRSGAGTWTAVTIGTNLTFSGGTLAASGGGYAFSSVSASYTETATSGEKVVAVTASGQTITLPTAVGNTAKLSFKLMVAGTLTLDGNAAETIDGGATAVLTAQYEAVTIVSNNADWIVI